MKVLLTFLCLSIACLPLHVQAQKNIKPVVIRGQLTNSPEKTLFIVVCDELNIRKLDTIHLDNAGKFHYTTETIKDVQFVSIQRNRTQFNNILVAPGYDLEITADATSYETIIKTRKINGIGAEANRYRLLYDSVKFQQRGEKHWLDMTDRNEFISFVKKEKWFSDSISAIVFNRTGIQEPYFLEFGEVIRNDNKFLSLYYITTYANIYIKQADSAEKFVNKNFNFNSIRDFSSDKFLSSKYYKDWLLTSELLTHSLRQDYSKDSSLRKDKWYKFKKISQSYHGKVREFALYELITANLFTARSVLALNQEKTALMPYMNMIKAVPYKKEIERIFLEKEKELNNTQVGKPAPLFTLTSDKGTEHSLSSLKGKVVYLDLWASWCKPCREETPYMRTLFAKYKDNPSFQMIGIAVSDANSDWRKALAEDKPEWLQLIDTDNTVSRSYVASAIPKFILIDKQGNIRHFNAPRPSEIEALQQLIDAELQK